MLLSLLHTWSTLKFWPLWTSTYTLSITLKAQWICCSCNACAMSSSVSHSWAGKVSSIQTLSKEWEEWAWLSHPLERPPLELNFNSVWQSESWTCVKSSLDSMQPSSAIFLSFYATEGAQFLPLLLSKCFWCINSQTINLFWQLAWWLLELQLQDMIHSMKTLLDFCSCGPLTSFKLSKMCSHLSIITQSKLPHSKLISISHASDFLSCYFWHCNKENSGLFTRSSPLLPQITDFKLCF